MKAIQSNDKSVKLIKALVEYASNQNKPIEQVIHRFLPDIYDADSFSRDKYQDLDRRLFVIETLLKENLDQKIIIQSTKAFWINIGILIAILGAIVGLIALFK